MVRSIYFVLFFTLFRRVVSIARPFFMWTQSTSSFTGGVSSVRWYSKHPRVSWSSYISTVGSCVSQGDVFELWGTPLRKEPVDYIFSVSLNWSDTSHRLQVWEEQICDQDFFSFCVCLYM